MRLSPDCPSRFSRRLQLTRVLRKRGSLVGKVVRNIKMCIFAASLRNPAFAKPSGRYMQCADSAAETGKFRNENKNE